MKPKLIRITTVPESLDKLLEGQLKFMSNHFEVVAVSSPTAKLYEVSEKEQVRVFGVEMTRKITPLKDLRAIWKLYRFLKTEKPEIVHTHTPKAGLVGMIAAKLANVPIRLHTVAGLPLMEASGLKRTILNWVEKFTYKLANKIYPNSFGLKEFIVDQKFCKEKKLKVIGSGSSNGINTEYFDSTLISEKQKLELKNSLGITSEDFVFVFVGRLVRDKGVNELINAFELFSKKSNFKLLLIGDFEKTLDPLDPSTISKIKESKNIIFVGFQKDVRPYFCISDCLVFPSYREGFPNVVLQAASMGIPSIVSDINGCNEIITHGKNGMLIKNKNLNELHNSMIEITSKFERYKKNNLLNIENISQKYSQKNFWKLILKEYKILLQNIN